MDRSKTELKIIEAAFDLFSERDFKATTTKDIAGSAGVNEVTLFRIFKNKENLFSEMVDHYTDVEKIAGQMDLSFTGDGRKDLKKFCKMMMKPIDVRSKLIRIMVGYTPVDPDIKKKLADFPVSMAVFFSEYLRTVIPESKPGTIDYNTSSLILMSYIFRYSLVTSFVEKDPFRADSNKNLDKFLDFFMKGLLPADGIKRGE